MSEMSPYDRCLIAVMSESNDGDREARAYLREKVETKDTPPPNTMGETVECERCFAVFRLNAGGVYLEQRGSPCDEPQGARGLEQDWQINLDYTHMY